MRSEWVLRSLTGEAADVDAPSGPAPRHPPEAVLAAVLAAARDGDAARMLAFASAAYLEAAGGAAAFETALRRQPLAVLMGHRVARVARMEQQSRHCCVALVDVESALGTRAVATRFHWALGLQQSGPLASCWLTEGVPHVASTRFID